ncbi:plant regulator RWP-RK family protein [Striga asiatica]|uniref:Plant regulator RWP-RK family protein n=1 Tax=Striga asiatica TaxID=4170 RepID=A0A5A7RKX5_STRAF|nr:plant regulator RWP-RK family protein [Striga asiatica]
MFTFVENPSLVPSNVAVASTDEQYYLDYSNNEHQNHDPNSFMDSEDPIWDPMIWALCNEPINSVSTNLQGEGTSGNNGNFNIDNVIPMPLSVSHVPSTQYNCTCCQILREITHSNGNTIGVNVKRLEIHGRFGVIMHAILGIYELNSSLQCQDTQIFRNESTQMVKKFMVQYFEACKREGYNIVQDPLSPFYEALCVGLNESDNLDDFLQSSPDNEGDYQNCPQEPLQEPEGESNQMGSTKIPLSMQRERTRNLRMKDFVQYSDLPIEYAARKMNLCPTVVKKICRKNGVERWPYRKIKSLRRKLSKKKKILDSASDAKERAQALKDIQEHEEELAEIYIPFNK